MLCLVGVSVSEGQSDDSVFGVLPGSARQSHSASDCQVEGEGVMRSGGTKGFKD